MKVYGPGVEKEGLTTAMPSANFTVDTKESGPGAVKVSCEGPKGNVPVKVKDNKDGTYSCSYKPDDKGYYTVKVSLDGQPVKDSPFEVQVKEVTDPRKVKVTGDGLKGGKVRYVMCSNNLYCTYRKSGNFRCHQMLQKSEN